MDDMPFLRRPTECAFCQSHTLAEALGGGAWCCDCGREQPSVHEQLAKAMRDGRPIELEIRDERVWRRP